MGKSKTQRLASIDFWRAIGIFAIILIHTTPFRLFEQSPWVYLRMAINQSTRFAVPYFFIVSGYFWGRKVRNGTNPLSLYGTTAKRLLFPFVLWSVIYVITPTAVDLDALKTYGYWPVVRWKLSVLLAHPVTLLFEGGKVHLWFLVALLCAVTLATLLHLLKWQRAFLPLGVLLYGAGLLAGPYVHTPLGLHIPFNLRDGPFVSTLFFALGWHLARQNHRPAARRAWAIFLLGWGLQFAEAAWLWMHYGLLPTQIDVVLGTVGFGYGAALLALSHPRWGTQGVIPKFLARAGRDTMGVYLVHILFVDWLRPWIDAQHRVGWELVYPVAVYALSLASVKLYARLRP